jgi:ubiquitin-activating enzyme E1
LFYDIFEAIPEGEVDRTPQNSRYDDQIKIFGKDIQEKLGNIKTFMVGAGALGCEFIKAFSLMGVGCGPEGKV